MKARLLPFLIVACLPICACPSFSAQPLYTDQDAVVEPALEGTWNTDSDDNVEFVFEKSGDHEYSLAISSTDPRIRQNYKVHLVRLRGQLFMDLAFENQTIEGTQVDEPVGMIQAHVITKVNISGDDLAYAALEDDAILKEGPSEGTLLHYHQIANQPLLVTAEADVLRDYISAHAEDAFPEIEHLRRKQP